MNNRTVLVTGGGGFIGFLRAAAAASRTDSGKDAALSPLPGRSAGRF